MSGCIKNDQGEKLWCDFDFDKGHRDHYRGKVSITDSGNMFLSKNDVEEWHELLLNEIYLYGHYVYNLTFFFKKDDEDVEPYVPDDNTVRDGSIYTLSNGKGVVIYLKEYEDDSFPWFMALPSFADESYVYTDSKNRDGLQRYLKEHDLTMTLAIPGFIDSRPKLKPKLPKNPQYGDEYLTKDGKNALAYLPDCDDDDRAWFLINDRSYGHWMESDEVEDHEEWFPLTKAELKKVEDE